MGKTLEKSFTLVYILGLVVVNVTYFSVKSIKNHSSSGEVSLKDSLKPSFYEEEIIARQVSLK